MTTTHPLPLRIVIAMTLVFSLGLTAAFSTSSDHAQEVTEWRARRLESLTSDVGWLTLTGLFWLEPGENTVGSESDATVRLPDERAPSQVGTFGLHGTTIQFESAPGVEVTHDGTPVDSLVVAPDSSGDATLLEIGAINFFVIERGDRFAVRVRDRSHPARQSFLGLDYFPIDPEWNVAGRFEPHEPTKTIPVPNVLGTVNKQPSPGRVVFEKDGESYRLDALEGPNGQLFLVFADQTSGDSTYGGGRFLYTAAPGQDGQVTLDFNKSYNPPCAFTDFATCPLPPRQNRLRIEIEAGEKTFDRPHHGSGRGH